MRSNVWRRILRTVSDSQSSCANGPLRPLGIILVPRCSVLSPDVQSVRSNWLEMNVRRKRCAILDQSSLAPIIAEPVHLVHPLMQDRHDADVAVQEPPPVDEMMGVPKVEPLHPELGRNRARSDTVPFNPIKYSEQFGDVSIGLVSTPAAPRLAINLIQPQGRGLLDAHGHPVSPCCAR